MIPINDLSRGFLLYQQEYENKALQVLRSGWYILGKEVSSFEKEFSTALDSSFYCAGVDNGLDAIALGLKASGIQPGDEIIVQANGYIATVLGILQCGAIPVFVDSDDRFQLDWNKIEASVTFKTKAVLVTHLYGLTTIMDPIMDICQKYGLLLFEDCAQAHFSSYNGKYAGCFGTASFFSFYPTKNLGGFGDGGAVISNNKEIIDRVKILRNYGSDSRYHNIEIGYNARLDELQAGLLRVKLSHMDTLIANRRYIADRYLKEIHNSKVVLPVVPEKCEHIWYQFVIRTVNQQDFIAFLNDNEVAADITWKTPVYLQPCIAEEYGYNEGDFPVADMLCNSIVSLPIMDQMSKTEINRVIDVVNRY